MSRAFPDTDEWSTMVEDFTSREITKEQDRLSALAGLAERFQSHTGCVYLAGLWLGAMPTALVLGRRLWQSMRRPLAYRAPAWSWAALEGEVDFPGYDFDDPSPLSTIVGQFCQYSPPETFATVTDGWIDIEGLISVASGWTMHDGDSWLSGIRLFTHDHPEDTQNPQYWIAILDQGNSLKEEISRSEIHLLEVLAANTGVNVLRRYLLVLQIAGRHGAGHDCFQRLGIAYMDSLPSSIPATDSWARTTIRLI